MIRFDHLTSWPQYAAPFTQTVHSLQKKVTSSISFYRRNSPHPFLGQCFCVTEARRDNTDRLPASQKLNGPRASQALSLWQLKKQKYEGKKSEKYEKKIWPHKSSTDREPHKSSASGSSRSKNTKEKNQKNSRKKI